MLEEVEQGVKPQLAKLEEQRHEVLDQRLDQLIGERLLAQEAKRRSISVEELLKPEVLAKAPEVPDTEVPAFITQNKTRLPKLEDAELRLQVWDHLRAQKVNDQRQAYVQGLRDQGQVTVFLQAPDGARAYGGERRSRLRQGPQGRAHRPSWSSRISSARSARTSTPTLQQVLDKYPGKVKLVWRDYPLVSSIPGRPRPTKRPAARPTRASSGSITTCSSSARRATVAPGAQALRPGSQARRRGLRPVPGQRQRGRGRQGHSRRARASASPGRPASSSTGGLEGAQPFTAFQKIIDSELAKVAAKK